MDVKYDNRLDSYAAFLDYDWVGKFLDLTERTRLSQAAFDLVAEWKGISNTFRQPWLIVTVLESFHVGFTQTREPFWKKLTSAFSAYIVNRADLELSHMKRQQIQQIIGELGSKVTEDIKNTPSPFDRQVLWQGLLESTEFVLAIRGSMRLCYSALYFAYEDFLRHILAIAKGDDSYRVRNATEFQRDLDQHLGSTMGSQLLADQAVVVGRLTRNALAHNGGRMTDELARKSHDFRVAEDGMIQIIAEHVRKLYSVLQDKLTTAATTATKLPSFQL